MSVTERTSASSISHTSMHTATTLKHTGFRIRIGLTHPSKGVA